MDKVKISKLLALGLRHKPDALNLTLDRDGWALVSDVIKGVRNKGYNITEMVLKTIIDEDDKQRYALSPNGCKIRANQGHSFSGVDLKFEPTTPPDVLFHGTSRRNVGSIMANGLKKASRHYVHLSESIETATKVGARRAGETVIFRIDAATAHAAGVIFYVSENRVWLVDELPRQYLSLD
jgi:putative RNA 2'-phosphotransferase